MKAFSHFFLLPLLIRSRFVIVLSIAKVHSDPLVCAAGNLFGLKIINFACQKSIFGNFTSFTRDVFND